MISNPRKGLVSSLTDPQPFAFLLCPLSLSSVTFFRAGGGCRTTEPPFLHWIGGCSPSTTTTPTRQAPFSLPVRRSPLSSDTISGFFPSSSPCGWRHSPPPPSPSLSLPPFLPASLPLPHSPSPSLSHPPFSSLFLSFCLSESLPAPPSACLPAYPSVCLWRKEGGKRQDHVSRC